MPKERKERRPIEQTSEYAVVLTRGEYRVLKGKFALKSFHTHQEADDYKKKLENQIHP